MIMIMHLNFDLGHSKISLRIEDTAQLVALWPQNNSDLSMHFNNLLTPMLIVH